MAKHLNEYRLAVRISSLGADEQRILIKTLERLEQGKKEYGEWKIPDGRDYDNEVLEEVIDALQYCAAKLIENEKR